MGRATKFAVLLLVATLLSGVGAAWACNVPVFRYAIERWRPDPYRAVLFHRGPLSAADREQLQPLEDQQDEAFTNLSIRTVDLDNLDEASEEGAADAALFAALGKPEQSTLVVQYPPHLNIHKPVFVGEPGREAIAKLSDSPARQELTKRLAAGQTAVWLLLESGQPEQDDAAAALLEAELKKLEKTLELPELTTAPEDALLSSAPLAVGFSLLRVKRDDPAEQTLAAMLIHSESDLAERTDPMVFPVYGRGRALWGLIGPGITAKNIYDSASFLVGPCSCEVKELNPGFDLLLTADWDQLLSQSGIPLTAVETKTTAPPAEAELVPIPAGQPVLTAPLPAPVMEVHAFAMPVATWVILGGIGALAVIGLVVVAVVIAAAASSRPGERA